MELAPEGTGFRSRTRFARFFNLPELMAMWREAADIQTAEMLKLPVPEHESIIADLQARYGALWTVVNTILQKVGNL